MIHIKNLTYLFGTRKLYDNLSCSILEKDRVGLVGLNGSGKSTLLKLIADALTTANPAISIPKTKKIAYFPQEIVLQSDKTIYDETFSSRQDITDLLAQAARLEEKLTNAYEDAVLEKYVAVQEKLARLNVHEVKAKAEEVLFGLGFTREQFDKPVNQLSVGWKMRIVLAKLLVQDADFYLFDEPTNHLDIVAKEWFLQFLLKSSFGFILVCHERYLLNKACSSIFELELGKGKMFTGNYQRYLELKERESAILEGAYEQQQKQIQAKQAVIDRFRAGTRAKMAQSMLKALDKVERITLPPKPKSIAIDFPPIESSAKVVLQVNNVGYAFKDKPLFKNVNFSLERGDKMALIAPNGMGKTTLFNLIAGCYPLQEGTVTFGDRVTFALFDQDQTASLPADKTIFQALQESCPTVSTSVIRGMLGAFLFSADDQYKKISVLSGGERNRVGMIKVLLQKANLFLLDEPTNHLDMPSKEVLLQALQEYKGTILFVSHDQDFINKVANKIAELTPQGVAVYTGNYDDFVYQKKMINAAQSQQPQQEQRKEEKKKKAQTYISVDTKSLESKLKNLERSIEKMQLSFAQLMYGTPAFEQAQQKLKDLEEEYEQLMEEWVG